MEHETVRKPSPRPASVTRPAPLRDRGPSALRGPGDGEEGHGQRRASHDAAVQPHHFGEVRIFPVFAPPGRGASSNIPRADGAEGREEDLPDGGGAPAGDAPAGDALAGGDSCEQPRSMHKVTSGSFWGGLTINDYYPDLRSRGYPAAAGPFVTANRFGSSVQLLGVIPSPCIPSRFRLEQTCTKTRARTNGVVDPEEGTTFDDIARSGRDATRAPFRQEFLGGGDAPLGYIISMADPPSSPYDATTTTEQDRTFVTSLVGPGGRRSVTWQVSRRAVAGSITRNTVS